MKKKNKNMKLNLVWELENESAEDGKLDEESEKEETVREIKRNPGAKKSKN